MSKKFYISLTVIAAFLTIIMLACSGPDKPADTADSTAEQTIIDQPDTVLFWTVDDYNKTKSQVYKDTIEVTDPKSVVNGINSIYPDIHLEYIKQSNDTVYAIYLHQRYGLFRRFRVPVYCCGQSYHA